MMAEIADAADFDAGIWRAQAGSSADRNPRHAMVRDLRERHLTAGMTRTEITALLGTPDRREGRRDTYILGPASMGVDFEYLVLDYDGGERLSGSRVTRG